MSGRNGISSVTNTRPARAALQLVEGGGSTRAASELSLHGVTISRTPRSLGRELRLEEFRRWCRERVSCRADVMAGTAVIAGTRLPVRSIAGRLNAGDARREVLEDYPYLVEEDLDFALLFADVNPSPRERSRASRQAAPR